MDPTLNHQIQQHQQRWAILADRYAESKKAYEALRDQALYHQHRIDLQPEVREILEELQQAEHERALGAYEQLLTALVRDIMPGDRSIVLDLTTQKGLPALDIYIRKGEGSPLEDVLYGSGGSITNILSVGLRMIALLRSGKRKLLVLDEPDNWLKEIYAPAFTRVIQEVSHQLGIQVLMISHHSEDVLQHVRHRLHLEKTNTGLRATWAPGSDHPTWQEDQEGLRSIYLEDFRSHVATHIPLSPGLTLLYGDNDIGKSVIPEALQTVVHNTSHDGQIRHYQDSMSVVLDFGPLGHLVWQRHKKGKTKVSYRHLSGYRTAQETSLHASDGARETPSWVEEVFGLGLIQGMDVQITFQKEPIFLLNQPASQRAKVLAIGQEGSYVQTMMALDKTQLQEAKTFVKASEKELEKIHRRIQVLAQALALEAPLSRLVADYQAMTVAQSKMVASRELLASWGFARTKTDMCASLRWCQIPAFPTWKTDASQVSLLRTWAHARQRQSCLDQMPSLPAAYQPVAPSSRELLEAWANAQGLWQVCRGKPSMPSMLVLRSQASEQALLKNYYLAQQKQALLADFKKNWIGLQMPKGPNQEDVELMRRWSEAQSQCVALEHERHQLGEQIQSVALVIQRNTCPTCGQALLST